MKVGHWSTYLLSFFVNFKEREGVFVLGMNCPSAFKIGIAKRIKIIETNDVLNLVSLNIYEHCCSSEWVFERISHSLLVLIAFFDSRVLSGVFFTALSKKILLGEKIFLALWC